jgi:hypothetical protein
MIVASWLVSLDPRRAQVACQTLSAVPGRELRRKSGSHTVVLVTEGDADVVTLRQELLQVPGVQAAEPVASFDDQESGLALVRW